MLLSGILFFAAVLQIVKNAFAKYDLSLGVGLSQISGKVFRIGECISSSALWLVKSKFIPTLSIDSA